MQRSSPLCAEIVTTGTEILLGDIVDTNAAWIAQQLRDIGVNLYYKTTVGDNEERVRGVLEMCLSRSDVIIVTGGLGPTADDITRDAIANATGCLLERNDEIIAGLHQRFARWGTKMTANNERQAYLPQGCTVVPNPQGTAPGFVVRDQRYGRNAFVIALPGVPREMKAMMTETVLPFLKELRGEQGVIHRRILRTIGIGESAIDDQIHDLMQGANPTVGTAAHTGQVDIRVAARAGTVTEAEALIDKIVAEIQARIGPYIYSTTSGETIEATLAKLMVSQQVSLALVETTSEGAIAERLLSVLPEPQLLKAHFRREDVGLFPSVAQVLTSSSLNETTARQAAAHLKTAAGADYAIVALGSGKAAEHFYAAEPGQTIVAIAGPKDVQCTLHPSGGRDEITTLRLGHQVFELMRRALLNL